MTGDPSPQITVEQLHGMQWATGFQYCTVWRQAKNGDPFDLADPPDGEGWEVNVDREGGSQVTVPRWSDGTVVHQAMYWRRPVKDMVAASRVDRSSDHHRRE